MECDPTEQFRSWLADCSRQQRLTHEEIAQRSGINRSTVTRVLNGNRGVTLDTAVRLVNALRAPVPPALEPIAGVTEAEDRLRALLTADQSLPADAVDELIHAYRALRRLELAANGGVEPLGS